MHTLDERLNVIDSEGNVLSLSALVSGMNERDSLKAALAAESAERIALADSFREVLERRGFEPTTAALLVQSIIDRAAAKHREAIRNG